MARPRRDGLPARATTKRKLNDAFVAKLKPPAGPYPTLVWDLKVGGLALSVQPSGRKTWKCIYSFNRRPRWMTIGTADVMDVDTARKQAAGILLKVQTGVDVLAEQQAHRGLGTFEELGNRYRDEYAMKKNKSWKQSRDLIDKHIMPRWGKLQAASISRSDVKAALAAIEFGKHRQTDPAGCVDHLFMGDQGRNRRDQTQPLSTHRRGRGQKPRARFVR